MAKQWRFINMIVSMIEFRRLVMRAVSKRESGLKREISCSRSVPLATAKPVSRARWTTSATLAKESG